MEEKREFKQEKKEFSPKEFSAIEFRACLNIKVIKEEIINADKSFTREFLISDMGKSDTIILKHDDFGTKIEQKNGTFTEEEFEIIKEHILFQGSNLI